MGRGRQLCTCASYLVVAKKDTDSLQKINGFTIDVAVIKKGRSCLQT